MNRFEPNQIVNQENVAEPNVNAPEARFEEVLVEGNAAGNNVDQQNAGDPLIVKNEAIAFQLNQHDENELIEIIDNNEIAEQFNTNDRDKNVQVGSCNDKDDEPIIFELEPNVQFPLPLMVNEYQLIKKEDDFLSGNLPFTQKVSFF